MHHPPPPHPLKDTTQTQARPRTARLSKFLSKYHQPAAAAAAASRRKDQPKSKYVNLADIFRYRFITQSDST
jgi:hypothetical protein